MLAFAPFVQGCSPFLVRGPSQSQEIEDLRKQLEEAKSHPREIIKTKEGVKVVEDVSKQMAWFRFIGIILIGLGVGIIAVSLVWKI